MDINYIQSEEVTEESQQYLMDFQQRVFDAVLLVINDDTDKIAQYGITVQQLALNLASVCGAILHTATTGGCYRELTELERQVLKQSTDVLTPVAENYIETAPTVDP